MLFDFTDPRFISEFWLTFLTKGAMGLGAGLVMYSAQKRSEGGYVRSPDRRHPGCVIYYILYFTKSYYYNALLVEALQSGPALVTLAAKIPASCSTASSPLPPLRLCAWPSARGSSGPTWL